MDLVKAQTLLRLHGSSRSLEFLEADERREVNIDALGIRVSRAGYIALRFATTQQAMSSKPV